MSGHSHWSTIKHKKAIVDKKRGKVFSKMASLIAIAAKEKGGDPETNPALRLAISQAKGVNMPKDNIERAIKKGTGELSDGTVLEEVLYEAYAPGGTAIIVDTITDNRNRTLTELKQIINSNNGKLAESGSVQWLFEKRGIIAIELEIQSKNLDELELAAIDAGAEDTVTTDAILEVHTQPKDVMSVKEKLEAGGVTTASAVLGWVAKEDMPTEKPEAVEKLFEALDDQDDVQNIYSNLAV